MQSKRKPKLQVHVLTSQKGIAEKIEQLAEKKAAVLAMEIEKKRREEQKMATQSEKELKKAEKLREAERKKAERAAKTQAAALKKAARAEEIARKKAEKLAAAEKKKQSNFKNISSKLSCNDDIDYVIVGLNDKNVP